MFHLWKNATTIINNHFTESNNTTREKTGTTITIQLDLKTEHLTATTKHHIMYNMLIRHKIYPTINVNTYSEEDNTYQQVTAVFRRKSKYKPRENDTRQTDRQTDTFIEPICYRFLIEINIIKGKETLTKTLQSLS